MSIAFVRSTRALRVDGFGRWGVRLLLGMCIVGAWAAWALLARVAVTVESVSARLQAGGAPYPVAPSVAGRVLKNNLSLGKRVAAGEILLELDATTERLRLAETTTRISALAPQIAARRRELEAETSAEKAHGRRGPLAVAEARAKLAGAETAAQQAADVAARQKNLFEAKAIGIADLQAAQAEARRLGQAADAERLAVSRIETEQRFAEGDRRVRIEAVAREIAVLEGEASELQATARRLENEVELRVVHASSAGYIADAAQAPEGTVVREGERLAIIVPGGEVVLHADFAPAAALGRIKPGQPARLRLDGFPWTQYGTVPATVAQVASELRDGQVRVELTVQPGADTRVPLEHGLPGIVEIELERVAPATLFLRAAGKIVDR